MYYYNRPNFGAMDKMTDTSNCACLHGTPYIDSHGNCQCDQNQVPLFPRSRVILDAQPPIYINTPVNTGKITQEVLAQLQQQSGVNPNMQTATGASNSNLLGSLMDNKWLVLAGALGLGYVVMNSGAKPKSRVTTSEIKF